MPDYVKATVETVLKIHETEDDGDVLAFLTGQVSGYICNTTQPLLLYSSVACLSSLSLFSSYHLLVFSPSGRGGEGGVPSAGTGQDSVPIRHEETPENLTHVLRSTLR